MKGLSIGDGGLWRIAAGFSVAVWFLSWATYSFASITHFGNMANQPIPIPTWALQAVTGMIIALGVFMVARYFKFYVIELLSAQDAAKRAMLIEYKRN